MLIDFLTENEIFHRLKLMIVTTILRRSKYSFRKLGFIALVVEKKNRKKHGHKSHK